MNYLLAGCKQMYTFSNNNNNNNICLKSNIQTSSVDCAPPSGGIHSTFLEILLWSATEQVTGK